MCLVQPIFQSISFLFLSLIIYYALCHIIHYINANLLIMAIHNLIIFGSCHPQFSITLINYNHSYRDLVRLNWTSLLKVEHVANTCMSKLNLINICTQIQLLFRLQISYLNDCLYFLYLHLNHIYDIIKNYEIFISSNLFNFPIIIFSSYLLTPDLIYRLFKLFILKLQFYF